jgi:probable rRNA maturation factor
MKVFIQNLQNKFRLTPGLKALLEKTVISALTGGKKDPRSQIAILIVNDAQIKEFNLLYHATAYATDVLTFDLSENKRMLSADIIISAETAKNNAKAYKTTTDYEIMLYAAHGILHLLGENDDTAEKRQRMNQKADKIVKKILLAHS